jgi:hypothetical protein
MKMHLSNILNFVDATIEEKKKAFEYFKNHKVSFKTGSNFIMELRKAKAVLTNSQAFADEEENTLITDK